MLAIDDDVRAVHQARDFTRAALDDVGAAGRRAPTPMLLASELVTNAILHGRPPIQLRLRLTPASTCCIEVDDAATAVPRKLRPTAERRSTAAGCSSSRAGRRVGHAAAARRQVRLVRAGTDPLRLKLDTERRIAGTA